MTRIVVETTPSASSSSSSSTMDTLNNNEDGISDKFSRSLSDLTTLNGSKTTTSFKSGPGSVSSSISDNDQDSDHDDVQSQRQSKSMSMSSLRGLFIGGCFPVSRGSPDGSSSNYTHESIENQIDQRHKQHACNQDHAKHSTLAPLYRFGRYLAQNHRPKRTISEQNLTNRLANGQIGPAVAAEAATLHHSESSVSNSTSVPNISILHLDLNPDPGGTVVLPERKQQSAAQTTTNTNTDHIATGGINKYRKNDAKKSNQNRYTPHTILHKQLHNNNINSNTLPHNLARMATSTATTIRIPTADSSLSLGLGSTISFTPLMDGRRGVHPSIVTPNDDRRYLTYGTSAQLQQEYGKFIPWPTLTEFRLRRKLRRFKRRARKLFNGNNLFGKSLERIQNVRRLIKIAKLAKQDPEQMLNEMMMQSQHHHGHNGDCSGEMSRSSSLTSLLNLIEEANKNLLNSFQEEDKSRAHNPATALIGETPPPPPPKCPPRLKRAMSSINVGSGQFPSSSSSTLFSGSSLTMRHARETLRQPIREQEIDRWSMTNKTTSDNYRIAFVENKQSSSQMTAKQQVATTATECDTISVKSLNSYFDSGLAQVSGANETVISASQQQSDEKMGKNSKILCVRSHFQINDGTIYLEDSDWEMCSEISEPLSLNDPSIGDNVDNGVGIVAGAAEEQPDKPSLVDLALSQSILNHSNNGYGSIVSDQNLEPSIAISENPLSVDVKTIPDVQSSIILPDIAEKSLKQPEESKENLENVTPIVMDDPPTEEINNKENLDPTEILQVNRQPANEGEATQTKLEPKIMNHNKKSPKRIKPRAPQPPVIAKSNQNESSKMAKNNHDLVIKELQTKMKSSTVESCREMLTTDADSRTSQKSPVVVDRQHQVKKNKKQKHMKQGFKLLKKFHSKKSKAKKCDQNGPDDDLINVGTMDSNSIEFLIEKFNQNKSIGNMFEQHSSDCRSIVDSTNYSKSYDDKLDATGSLTSSNNNANAVTNFERMCSLFLMINSNSRSHDGAQKQPSKSTMDNGDSSYWYFFIENMIRRIVIEQQQQQQRNQHETGLINNCSNPQTPTAMLKGDDQHGGKPLDNLMLLLLMLQYQQQQNQQQQLNELKLSQALRKQQQQQVQKQIQQAEQLDEVHSNQNEKDSDGTQFSNILQQVQQLLEQCKNNDRFQLKPESCDHQKFQMEQNDESTTEQTGFQQVVEDHSTNYKTSIDVHQECEDTTNRLRTETTLNDGDNQSDSKATLDLVPSNQAEVKSQGSKCTAAASVEEQSDRKIQVQVIQKKEESKESTTAEEDIEETEIRSQAPLKHRTVLQLKAASGQSKFRLIHSFRYHLEKKRNKSRMEKLKRQQEEQEEKRLDDMLRASMISLATVMEEPGSNVAEFANPVTLANTSTIEIKQIQQPATKTNSKKNGKDGGKARGTLRKLFSSLPRDGGKSSADPEVSNAHNDQSTNKKKAARRSRPLSQMNISEPFPLGVEYSMIMSRSTMNLNLNDHNNYNYDDDDDDEEEDFHDDSCRIVQSFGGYGREGYGDKQANDRSKRIMNRCMSERNFRSIIKLNESLNHKVDDGDNQSGQGDHQQRIIMRDNGVGYTKTEEMANDSDDHYEQVHHNGSGYGCRLSPSIGHANGAAYYASYKNPQQQQQRRKGSMRKLPFPVAQERMMASRFDGQMMNLNSSSLQSSTQSNMYWSSSCNSSPSPPPFSSSTMLPTEAISRTRLLNSRSILEQKHKLKSGSQNKRTEQQNLDAGPTSCQSTTMLRQQQHLERQPVVTFTLPRSFKTRTNSNMIYGGGENTAAADDGGDHRNNLQHDCRRFVPKEDDTSGEDTLEETELESDLDQMEEPQPYYFRHLSPTSKLNQRYFNANLRARLSMIAELPSNQW